MATWRSHTKSRSGCQQCKRRRVKCDEKLPLCGNCSRRGLECSLTSRPRAPIRADRSSMLTLIDPALLLSDRIALVAPSFPDFNDHGLELMHHYTTKTAITLALRLDMQHVWQMVAPEIGHGSPFLLQGILPLAALHKAYLIPPRKEEFLDITANYQILGMQGFRVTLENVGNANWDAPFSSSTILVVCALSQVGRTKDVIEGIFKLFVLIRGLSFSLAPADTHLAGTPLAPWSQGTWIISDDAVAQDSDPPLDDSPLPPDTFKALRRLLSFFRMSLPVSSCEGYEFATLHLRKAAVLVAHAGARAEINE